MAKMNRDTLESLLSRQQNTAVGALNGTIGRHRSELLDRYFGEPYGDEVKDRSTVVDTSVRDTIESIKPELMDIFLGGDAVVQFAPVGEEDVEGAEQETEVINHMFLQKNDGFMVLYSWFTDALLLKNGYVKRYWDERKYIEIEEYDDLTPEEAAALVEELEGTSDEVEFLERSGGIEEDENGLPVIDPMTGMPVVEPMYLKIRRTKTEKRYVVSNVPPEEILVSPQWHRIDFDGCPFVAHKRPIFVSDLLEMGFDRKQVEALPDHDARTDTEEAENRFAGEFFSEGEVDNSDLSMRQVLVFENYIRADYDGDGIAELLQVFTAGMNGEILKRNGKDAIQQVSGTCFEVLSPLPIPHKHYGMSIAELVQDLQRIKTVLTRQLLDNTVMGNNPDLVVNEAEANANTYADLQITQPGRVIRGDGPTVVTPLPVQSTIAHSLAAIEYVDGLRETRTGVTKMNQGIDPDALNTMAQRTVKSLQTAAMKKILLIARIFAETGVRRLFLSMHKDMRNGPVKEIGMRLRNQWVTVNPRMWKHRSDMIVNVGLGTGDRDIQFARLQMLLMEQKEAMAQGMVGYQHYHHTLRKMTELSGFKDVANFFPEPEEVAQAQAKQEPPPDIPLILAQAEVQKVQNDAQIKARELMIRERELQLEEMRAQREQSADSQGKLADIGVKRDEMRLKAAIETEKLALERQKLGLEGRRVELDGARIGVEREKISASAASQPVSEGGDDTKAALERMERMVTQLMQTVAQSTMEKTVAQLGKAVTAPKEIVRDENGRPVGVRTVTED
jgi:hypothetical protein